MRKREIVFAALAASFLTSGTAHAMESGTDCMSVCENTLGSEMFVYHPSTHTMETRVLTGCATETRINGTQVTTVTTCTYKS